MSDWNEQSAPNNNLRAVTIGSSKLVGKQGVQDGEFADEVSVAGTKADAEKQVQRKHPGVISSSQKNKLRWSGLEW